MSSRLLFLALCLILVFFGQGFNVLGSFISVPYDKITFLQAYTMAIPYIIVQRIFVSSAIYINHENSFMTNNQIVFFMLCVQFLFTLIVNAFYLKRTLYRSDYVAMCLFLFAYYLSYFGIPFISSSSPSFVKSQNQQNKNQEIGKEKEEGEKQKEEEEKKQKEV